jgi:hypothetical protein
MVLARILEAFGQELMDASEEEIVETAKELGMDLHQGSGAYAGLTFPARWQPSDFFDIEAIKRADLHRLGLNRRKRIQYRARGYDADRED